MYYVETDTGTTRSLFATITQAAEYITFTGGNGLIIDVETRAEVAAMNNNRLEVL